MKTKNVIKQLKEFQSATGVKWSILATAMGFDKFQMSRWVNGRTRPIKAHEDIIKNYLSKVVDSTQQV